jgi:urease accessory protein
MPTKSLNSYELSMLQLSDSFFPTGMYAMSNGLEAIFYEKGRMGPKELRRLLEAYLTNQLGPSDCTVLANAYDSALNLDIKGVLAIDRLAYCMKAVKEVRDASARSGTQLLRCVSQLTDGNGMLNQYLQAVGKDEASGIYPVALALATFALGIPKDKACLMLLYTSSVSIMGAALRLGMLNHLEGQKLLHELGPTIASTALKSAERPLAGVWQFDPEIQLFQIRHERMKSKMFIS